MTKEQWLEWARSKQGELSDLILAYHPASHSGLTQRLPITAPSAENACEVVREKIRAEADGRPPIQKFREALDVGDVDSLMALLNQAWFGVPESTSCWYIRGFNEAVNLLEDPPEPTEEEMRENGG